MPAQTIARALAIGVVLAVTSSVAAEEIAITAGQMLDVTTGKIEDGVVVIVEDGVITRVGKQASMTLPADMKTIDLSGHLIMPGFMDMHVHLDGGPLISFREDVGRSTARLTMEAYLNAQKTVAAGFTTVRNVGSSNFSVLGVRDAIRDGDISGPRIFAAGHALGVTGGHCDSNVFSPEMGVTARGVANGTDAVRTKVRENLKYGADLIKFCATGGVFSKGTKVGIQQYGFEEMAAIVDEAHRRGVTVAAHAHGTDGIKTAIRAGVDSIEHASFLDKEAVKMAKKAGTFMSMDIYNTEYTLTFGEANGVPEENLNKERLVSKRQRASFTMAVKAGLRMVFGSDAAIYPHGDNAKQFARMVDYGMTPLQAIQAATINSAALLKRSETLGQLKVGYAADIVAVSGNPLDDITRLEDVAFVMANGTLVKAPSGS